MPALLSLSTSQFVPMPAEVSAAMAISLTTSHFINRKESSLVGKVKDSSDVAGHQMILREVHMSKDGFEEGEASPCTPPERLIPGTGGRYEDWAYHPNRLEATVFQHESGSTTSDSDLTKVDASTQTDAGDSDDGPSVPKHAAVVMVDE